MSRTTARLAQRKKKRFLEALTRTCNVSGSCEMAGLASETAYYWKSRNLDFSAAWHEALERGLDALEDEVMRRAKDGVTEAVFYQGRVVGETRRHSDLLAMFILKSKRRDVWGEKQQLDVSSNIMLLTPEEGVQKALQLFDLMEKFVERHRNAVGDGPLVYDPGDDDLPVLVAPDQGGAGQGADAKLADLRTVLVSDCPRIAATSVCATRSYQRSSGLRAQQGEQSERIAALARSVIPGRSG